MSTLLQPALQDRLDSLPTRTRPRRPKQHRRRSKVFPGHVRVSLHHHVRPDDDLDLKYGQPKSYTTARLNPAGRFVMPRREIEAQWELPTTYAESLQLGWNDDIHYWQRRTFFIYTGKRPAFIKAFK